MEPLSTSKPQVWFYCILSCLSDKNEEEKGNLKFMGTKIPSSNLLGTWRHKYLHSLASKTAQTQLDITDCFQINLP